MDTTKDKAQKIMVQPQLNQLAGVINYIKNKCSYSHDAIDKKLMNGQIFETKPEGADIDTKLIEEILNDNDFY